MRVNHDIPPVYDNDSKILILGSFPSVKSREGMFFYHHKQNRFWHIMENLFDTHLESIDDKRSFLLSHHIALWDVVSSCTIDGSSDSSIRDVAPNDLSIILDSADISTIFANGSKAYGLYMEYQYERTGIMPYKLPSTSPANAAWTFDRLISAWSIILEYL